MAKIKSKQAVGKSKKVVVNSKRKPKKALHKKTKNITQEFQSVPLELLPENDKEDEESLDSDVLNSDNDENDTVSDAEDELIENDGNESEDEAEKHKRDLEKLKKSDPEFYKFLQENDKKLLDFNLSDEENEDEVEGDKEDKGVHEPSGTLDVASDESDFEVMGIIAQIIII